MVQKHRRSTLDLKKIIINQLEFLKMKLKIIKHTNNFLLIKLKTILINNGICHFTIATK